MRKVRMLVAAVVAGTLALPAPAVAAPAGAPGPDWQRYVLSPSTRDVRPVRVDTVSGAVRNPAGVVTGRGTTTLTYTAGGPPPVLLLDYGVDVGGIPWFDVTGVTGSPTLRASFSESRRFADADGDNNGEGPCCGIAPPGAEPFRWNEFTPTGPGVLRTQFQQGGERFERLTLTAPGTVTLRRVGIDYRAFLGTPDTFAGRFLSSDDTLNRIWYAGAHTLQLNMVPPGTQNDNRLPAIVDGAKRDRAIWSGDLVHQTPSEWNTFGPNGDEYVRDSLERFAVGQAPSGALAGHVRIGPDDPTPFFELFFSATYSMHAANAMVDYFRYTGDRPFAQRMLPVVRRQLAWDRTLVDARGLLVTGPDQGNVPPPPLCCGLDWDPYDGQKAGAVTAYNVVFFHTLTEAAYLEVQLGHRARGVALLAEAARLRRAINTHLLDPATGLYPVSETNRGLAQDANSLAVLWGVAPASRRAGILAALKSRLWTPVGVRPFSEDSGFQTAILSPFATGFETGARLSVGDTADALELFRRHWGRMVDESSPDYVGAIWEQMGLDGTPVIPAGFGNYPDGVSLAHGWSTGPTWQLSQYVLGISPVAAGYRTWVVAPHVGDLRWAQGRVPTRYGPISVRWSVQGERLRLAISAPRGTSGRIEVPSGHGRVDVVVNGHTVRAGAAPGTAVPVS